MQGLIHPADFLLDLLKQLLAGLGEGVHVERDVVVGRDKSSRRRQVVKDGAARPPLGCGFALPLPLEFQFTPVSRGHTSAALRGNAAHPRAGKAVEHKVARLRVVQNRGHDGQMRNLGVIGMRPVDSVGFAHGHIDGQRLATVWFTRIVGLAVVFHKLRQPRIGACGVKRRIGHRQDRLVRSLRKPFLLAEFRVL